MIIGALTVRSFIARRQGRPFANCWIRVRLRRRFRFWRKSGASGTSNCSTICGRGGSQAPRTGPEAERIMFAVRGIAVSFSTFVLLYSVLSLVVRSLWQRVLLLRPAALSYTLRRLAFHSARNPIRGAERCRAWRSTTKSFAAILATTPRKT